MRTIVHRVLAAVAALTLLLVAAGPASAQTPTPTPTWTNRYRVFAAEDPSFSSILSNTVLAQWHQAHAPATYYVGVTYEVDFEDALASWTSLNGGEFAPLQWQQVPLAQRSQAQLDVQQPADMAQACGDANLPGCFQSFNMYDGVRDARYRIRAIIYTRPLSQFWGNGLQIIYAHELGHFYGLDERYRILSPPPNDVQNPGETSIMEGMTRHTLYNRACCHPDDPGGNTILGPQAAWDGARMSAFWRGIDTSPANGTSSRTPAGPNGELRDWEASAIGGPYMKFKWRDYAWAEELHVRKMQKWDGSAWQDVGPQIEDTRGTGMHFLVDVPRVLEQDIDAGPGPSGPAPSLNTGPGTYRMCGQVAYSASEPGHVRRLSDQVNCSPAVTVSF